MKIIPMNNLKLIAGGDNVNISINAILELKPKDFFDSSDVSQFIDDLKELRKGIRDNFGYNDFNYNINLTLVSSKLDLSLLNHNKG